MSTVDPSIIAKATTFFAGHEPTSDEQTLITLFLQSIKTANSATLSKIVFAELDWLPFRFLHEQYYKELELVSLLAKATDWSTSPKVYADATALNLKLMQKTTIMQFMMGLFPDKRQFYDYLALSHAFMSQIRFLPLLPASNPLTSKFLNAIGEIEVANGRLIQTQIRMLKDWDVPLTIEEKEAIIGKNSAIVGELFSDLLLLLCEPKEQQAV